jgi:hypothetical protein
MALKPQLLFEIILLAICAAQATSQKIEQENIPQEIVSAVVSSGFDQNSEISNAINPFYLRGDFDGDGKPDYAVWIKSKKSHESGVAVWLSSRKKFIVLGAGTPFRFVGSTETDFDNLNVWRVYPKQAVESGVEAGPQPKLIGEAILLGKSESGGGLIYWTGKSFRWYQQGD